MLASYTRDSGSEVADGRDRSNQDSGNSARKRIAIDLKLRGLSWTLDGCGYLVFSTVLDTDTFELTFTVNGSPSSSDETMSFAVTSSHFRFRELAEPSFCEVVSDSGVGTPPYFGRV